MQTSGLHGVFFEPMRETSLQPLMVRWTDRNEDEQPESYLERVATHTGFGKTYGVVRGRRQLGLRVPIAPGAEVQRMWVMHCTPRWWTRDTLKEMLKDPAQLKEVEPVRKQMRREVPEGENPTADNVFTRQLWAEKVAPKFIERTAAPIREGSTVFGIAKPEKEWEHEPRAATADDGKDVKKGRRTAPRAARRTRRWASGTGRRRSGEASLCARFATTSRSPHA